MHRCLVAAGAAVALLFATSAAVAQQTSIGAAVGTPGIGVELGTDLSQTFGLRLQGNYFGLSRDVNSNRITYDGDLDLLSVGLVGDIYLFNSGFRLSGGAFYNKNNVDLVATPTGTVTVGGTTYTGAQIGRLDGRVDFNEFSPYAGIGYTTKRGGTGLSFVFDAGVLFQGAPDVRLTSSGPISTAPGFAADLERERAEIAEDIDVLKYYPVVRIGIAYRF
jgi:hypothetical protein